MNTTYAADPSTHGQLFDQHQEKWAMGQKPHIQIFHKPPPLKKAEIKQKYLVKKPVRTIL